MSQSGETKFENKANILSELWMKYRSDPELDDFFSYNDIGAPLGFLVSEKLVVPTDMAKSMVNETFDLLLAAFGLTDEGYESLNDIFLEEGYGGPGLITDV
jgi:hypothetical protein